MKKSVFTKFIEDAEFFFKNDLTELNTIESDMRSKFRESINKIMDDLESEISRTFKDPLLDKKYREWARAGNILLEKIEAYKDCELNE